MVSPQNSRRIFLGDRLLCPIAKDFGDLLDKLAPPDVTTSMTASIRGVPPLRSPSQVDANPYLRFVWLLPMRIAEARQDRGN
jgi:hypothetical protein